MKLISDRRLPHEKFCDLHIKYNDKFKVDEMGWMCGTNGNMVKVFGVLVWKLIGRRTI
jgi:hypothetical protein